MVDESDAAIKRSLRVVAYSCHAEARDRIRNVLEKEEGYREREVRAYSFYEYFCTNPVRFDVDSEAELKIAVYAPFVERVLQDYQFVPIDSSGDPDKWTLAPNTREILEQESTGLSVDVPNLVGGTYLGSRVYRKWKFWSSKGEQGVPPSDLYEIVVLDHKAFRQEYLSENWKDVLGEEYWSIRIKEFRLAGIYYWYRASSKQPACFIAVPISSLNFFYGYLISIVPEIILPQQQNVPIDKPSAADPKFALLREMQKLANDNYRPTLALFFNGAEECRFDSLLRNPAKATSVREALDNTLFFSRNAATQDRLTRMSEEPLEAGFAILWARRAYWLDSIDNRDPNSNKMERATKKLKDSLIFAKYVLASPGMINILREVTKMNPRYQPGNPLPTVLVFGGPGSGKEKIARLIPLFSDDYFDSDVTVVNLAALRPETAVVPLLTGLSLESNWGELSVRGILQKAKERDPSTKKGNLPVLILDELNSLDLESQGVLLRIIENGELQALGSPSSETVEFLIIGIINESPEELTQELVMANVSRARHLFGEIANALIGSILLRAKRLRPDLYYRLRRGGEITLPSLNARREDIPILFYHFLTAEFSELQPDMAAKISVDLGVFDFLLSREIDWSGNVRQLQMFAKKCCKHILSRHGGLLGEPRVRRSDTETVAKNSGLLV